MRPELAGIIKKGMPTIISDLEVDGQFLSEFESCQLFDSSVTEDILVWQITARCCRSNDSHMQRRHTHIYTSFNTIKKTPTVSI